MVCEVIEFEYVLSSPLIPLTYIQGSGIIESEYSIDNAILSFIWITEICVEELQDTVFVYTLDFNFV